MVQCLQVGGEIYQARIYEGAEACLAPSFWTEGTLR